MNEHRLAMMSSSLGTMVPRRLKYSDVVITLARRLLEFRTLGLERVIFTATTGRSGTKTLTKMLAVVPGCVALHEPYPKMNDEILKAASYGDNALVERTFRRIKAINILRASVGQRYYVEANHLFVKTFLPYAVEDFGDRLAVVHLVRPPTEVATSIYCLDQLPGTEIGNTWWLDHRAPANLIRIADLLETDPEFSHPYYRGLWYWYEMEVRFAAFRARFPSMKVAHFETAWFNQAPRVFDLLDDLGISYDKASISSVVGRREHLKLELKVRPPLSADDSERMDARFQQLLHERGIDIAALPYR
jgi:hypothetical protein